MIEIKPNPKLLPGSGQLKHVEVNVTILVRVTLSSGNKAKDFLSNYMSANQSVSSGSRADI